jgi:hypothetical protein
MRSRSNEIDPCRPSIRIILATLCVRSKYACSVLGKPAGYAKDLVKRVPTLESLRRCRHRL